jgi:CRISPR-associated endonuclease/helicase Cas3
MNLTPERFEEFFAALHPGRQAFPWQKRLCREIMRREWPRTLALPTASGKTSCIDIALYALAAGAGNAPRRILFVVDRRVIVDEAFNHANDIAQRLRDASDGILKEVADGLRARRGFDPSGDTDPLACFQLRGGTYRDNAWARTPSQPTVICSTVDQVGSRLLFRGYGISDYLLPLHAGLVANDTLILLDEAHCSNPFRQTLEAIARYRSSFGPEAPRAPFAYALLSATQRRSTEADAADAEPTFGLDAEDEANETLGRRIRARKPTRLVELGERTATSQFADRLVKEAVALAGNGAKRIGIIVNRVRSAQRVFERVPAPVANKALFVGRMRPLDRDASMRRWRDVLRSGATETPDEPVFVVATQCIEVGADLDFDALVTECASLDALRQRFGRLYRLGEPGDANPELRPPGVVVITKDGLTDDDPIYGSALRGTWEWLREQADEQDRIDFGIAAMAPRLADGAPAKTLVHAADAPVLLPVYLDQWVQTSPKPEHEAQPSLFLHGMRDESPDVQVCWRADLDVRKPDLWSDIVGLCPPSVGECMSVPLAQFRRWMRGQEDVNAGDVEGIDADDDTDEHEAHGRRGVLVWLGDDSFSTVEPRAIKPGYTVVIPAEIGGWQALGYVPEGDDVSIDRMAELGALHTRGRVIARVHEALLPAFPAGEAREELKALLDRQSDSEQTDPDDTEILAAAAEVFRSFVTSPEATWHSVIAKCLATKAGRRAFRVHRHPGGGWVLERHRALPRAFMRKLGDAAVIGDFTTEDDSSSFTVAVPLKLHLEGVADFARAFATACGLPPALTSDLALAARLHDLGKADPRFQSMLRGGAPAFASDGLDGLLAKSGGAPDQRSRERARRRSGYPVGGRHELLSLRLAQSSKKVEEQAHDLDLVLHLIASHHGRCRPFAPVVADMSGCNLAMSDDGRRYTHDGPTGTERIDSGVSDRFWRLVRKYGWWGLAYIEAIHVLADHRRSEYEERSAGETEWEIGDDE